MKTTKTILLIFMFTVMAILRIQAQTPGFEWAVQMGGDSLIQPTSIAVDADGNQIIVGTFRGIADFDPDPNNAFNLTSNGWGDIFIQKLDANGNLLWAASMGGGYNDRGAEVVIGNDGNIYATGYFWGTIDADPGDGVYELSQDRWTTMVLKIEPDGDLIWAKQMGTGNVGHAYGCSIAVDNNMNVITTGYFYGRVDFDPGPGTYNLTCTSYDVFIQKLDANGNFIWAKQIIGSDSKITYSLASDASGNIYTTGYFKGTVDFNPDSKLKYNLTSFGDYDAFVQKLTGNGNFMWAKQIGGTAQDLSYSIGLDPSGFLYTTGYFLGTADFNPGTGTYNMTSAGSSDAYILKLDLNGNFIWAKQLGGPYVDCGDEIAMDSNGNVYISGYFYSTADFDPGTGTSYLTSNGHADSFTYKSDPNGNFLWVTQTGGQDWDYGLSMALDGSGNIFTVGYFGLTADFNPGGNGTFDMTNSGAQDMFVQKLNPAGGDDCLVPTGLAVDNISENTADLSWNEVTGATGYYIRYREIAAEWIVSEIVDGTNLTISGLVPITAYEFQVRTDCFSNYSYSLEFVTPGGCPDNYEPNETMGAAAAIPVNTDITALIGSNGDQDWFSFSTTNPAKNIKVTLTNLPLDYNIKLYKSGGTLIGSSSNTGTTPESIIYNTTKSGTYYIQVSGVTGDTYDPVNCYTLRASISSASYKSMDALIENTDAAEGLTVYPNPSNSIFNFRLQTESKELVTLQLYDVAGRLVQEYQSISPDNIITVGENLENGVYVAVLTQGALQKFVRIAKVQ